MTSKTKKRWDARLVVVGGGGAGLSAALQAAELGADQIVVLEKRSNVGGNTALAGGLFGCESPVQAREKIVADRDVLFKKAINWARWGSVDPAIIRAFINKSGETIRWLENKGLEFKLIRLYPDQNPLVQHNPIGNGARLIKVLNEELKARGVSILAKTSVTKILRGDDGNIRGVLASNETEDLEISTSRVIIATGGFAGNATLLKKLCPPYYDGMPVSGLALDGDGIFLAEETGAAIENFATMIKEGPRLDLHKWPLMTFERDPSAVWVNQAGHRFIDETAGYRVFEAVNAMLRQPGKISYALFDDAIRKVFEVKMPDLGSAMETEVTRNRVKIADSLAEIADWIGAPVEILQQTIEHYNRCCAQGYDEAYAKDRRYLLPVETPPYYAIRGMSVLLDTIGGIRINRDMAVLDTSNSPIPGLFAAGVVTSGWEPETYCSDLSATAFGFAINSGRIAGENAIRPLS